MENSFSAWIQSHLKGDRVIWATMIALSLVSILVVYSATGSLAYKKAGGDTEHFMVRHTFLVFAALFIAYVFHKMDYIYFSRLSRLGLLASVPLLLIAWQFGVTYNEASRWLIIPFINYTFQPSDLAKLSLIANMAAMLSKRQSAIKDFKKGVGWPVLAWSGIICGLIGVTNWSSAALLFATCLLLMFIGRVPVKDIAGLVMVGMLAGVFAFTFGQRSQTVTSRMEAFLSETNIPFQAEQSFIAVARGGFTGMGVGKSIQKSFLPHPYSDFIYAIIIEEYGMLGGIIILGLYLVLLYRGMMIVARSERAFGGLLAAGLTFSIVVQALIHMGVVVGLMPVTGLTLPLISMGGTSLMFTGTAMGMVLSVSRFENEDNAKNAVR